MASPAHETESSRAAEEPRSQGLSWCAPFLSALVHSMTGSLSILKLLNTYSFCIFQITFTCTMSFVLTKNIIDVLPHLATSRCRLFLYPQHDPQMDIYGSWVKRSAATGMLANLKAMVRRASVAGTLSGGEAGGRHLPALLLGCSSLQAPFLFSFFLSFTFLFSFLSHRVRFSPLYRTQCAGISQNAALTRVCWPGFYTS